MYKTIIKTLYTLLALASFMLMPVNAGYRAQTVYDAHDITDAFEGRELTVSELENVNKKFIHYMDVKSQTYDISPFLTLCYNSPDEISIYEIFYKYNSLMYISADEKYCGDIVKNLGYDTEAYRRLVKTGRFKDGGIGSGSYIDYISLESRVKKYTGISAMELAHSKEYFDEETNRFFFQDSYNNNAIRIMGIEDYTHFIYGKTDGTSVILVSEINDKYHIYRFEKTGSSYIFAMHLTADSFDRNIYTENGWQTKCVYNLNEDFMSDFHGNTKYNEAISAYKEYLYSNLFIYVEKQQNKGEDILEYVKSSPRYEILDMNRDGIPELKVIGPTCIELCQYKDGQITRIPTALSSYSFYMGDYSSGHSDTFDPYFVVSLLKPDFTSELTTYETLHLGISYLQDKEDDDFLKYSFLPYSGGYVYKYIYNDETVSEREYTQKVRTLNKKIENHKNVLIHSGKMVSIIVPDTSYQYACFVNLTNK